MTAHTDVAEGTAEEEAIALQCRGFGKEQCSGSKGRCKVWEIQKKAEIGLYRSEEKMGIEGRRRNNFVGSRGVPGTGKAESTSTLFCGHCRHNSEAV